MALNKEMFYRIADAIEKQQVRDKRVGLDMSTWDGDSHPTCGTAACIAGFAALIEEEMFDEFFSTRSGTGGVYGSFGAELLGLSGSQAQELFYGGQKYGQGRGSLSIKLLKQTGKKPDNLFIDRANLINENEPLVPNALRWMADTGKINWKKALEASACMMKRNEKEVSNEPELL